MNESTWYRIRSWGCGLEPVRVVSHTEQFVTVLETGWDGKASTRRRKRAGQYFETYAEARDEIVRSAEVAVESAKASLDRAKSKLAAARALPETAP